MQSLTKVNGVTYAEMVTKADEIYRDEIEIPLLKFIDELIGLGIDVNQKVDWKQEYRPEYIKK